MNILNFLDANAWLALLWSRHIHSERAGEWFERASEEKFSSAESHKSLFSDF